MSVENVSKSPIFVRPNSLDTSFNCLLTLLLVKTMASENRESTPLTFPTDSDDEDMIPDDSVDLDDEIKQAGLLTSSQITGK
jgi:hypothetical protein